MQILQAEQHRPRTLFQQNMLQFFPDTLQGNPGQHFTARGFLHQLQGLGLHVHVIAFFKPDSPQQPGRIFNEAQVVKHPDQASFEILPAPEEIDDVTKITAVQGNSHGVDCEIAPVKVLVQGGRLDLGHGCRVLIEFHPCCSDINLLTARKQYGCRMKFWMNPDPTIIILTQGLGQYYAVPFHNKVDVQTFHTQEEIADHTTGGIDFRTQPVCNCPGALHNLYVFLRQPPVHQFPDIIIADLLVANSRYFLMSILHFAMECSQHVGAGDNSYKLSLFKDRKTPDVVPDHQLSDP